MFTLCAVCSSHISNVTASLNYKLVGWELTALSHKYGDIAPTKLQVISSLVTHFSAVTKNFTMINVEMPKSQDSRN